MSSREAMQLSARSSDFSEIFTLKSMSVSDVSSDLTVEVGASSFALHKFPLVSRSGRIRKLLLEARDPTTCSRISLSAVPGGPEAFELAAKFCYGENVEITLSNVAALRCAAHFLEMTEEFGDNNLAARSEEYLKDMVLPSMPGAISVLHSCESLWPVSEETNLVDRLVAAIASNACKEELASGFQRLDHNFPTKQIRTTEPERGNWWGDSLAVLKLDFFKRVVCLLKSKGLEQESISKILVNYAQSSLQCLVVQGSVLDKELKKKQSSLQCIAQQGTVLDTELKKKQSSLQCLVVQGTVLDTELKKSKRAVIEATVSLLPTQSRKSPVPMSFLSTLLKASISASSSTSCKSDLERRIGLQLDQAILEDILFPGNDTLYDTDSVSRIFSIFLNLDENDYDNDDDLRDGTEMMYGFDSPGSPKQSSILKVSKLMDSFLAEVALDSELVPLRFICLAELLPDHARVVSDGLYRAVDIFLKVHPDINESERYRLCKAIDCKKLSQEACSHAAQNDRLPVQTTVQVLYLEQTRLRHALSSSGGPQSHHHHLLFAASFPGATSPRDSYASVRRENRELKLEVARMRMRLTDLERDHVTMKQELARTTHHHGHVIGNKILRSLAKNLSVIFRTRKGCSEKGRFLFQRRCNSAEINGKLNSHF